MKAKRTGLFFTKMKGIKRKVSGLKVRIRKLKKKAFLFTSSFVVIRNCGPIATKNLTELFNLNLLPGLGLKEILHRERGQSLPY